MELFWAAGRMTDLDGILILLAGFVFTVWGIAKVKRDDRRTQAAIDLAAANEAGR